MSVALCMQHAMRMHRIGICGLPHSTILYKRYNFRKDVIEHKMCLSTFSTFFLTFFFILRRTERDMIQNVYWSSCKRPSSLSDFKGTGIFWTVFRKLLKYQISWTSVGGSQVVPRGQTDTTKWIVSFRSFVNAPKDFVFV